MHFVEVVTATSSRSLSKALAKLTAKDRRAGDTSPTSPTGPTLPANHHATECHLHIMRTAEATGLSGKESLFQHL